jgi:hypothetical protein
MVRDEKLKAYISLRDETRLEEKVLYYGKTDGKKEYNS